MTAADDAAAAIRDAILGALDADPATREPLNALVVWTELGKGLAGTLDRKGADLGLIDRVIAQHARARGAADVDLAAWLPHVAADRRLTPDAVATSLRRVQTAIERAAQPLAQGSEGGGGPDGGRAVFLAVVKGWFPAGVSILRALPGRADADESHLVAALAAWCARYLPKDPSGARDLGVYVTRK